MKLDFLNQTILKEFKIAINDHSDFLIHKYGNFDGRNKMNALFSARDWLHIVVNGLPNVNIHHENDDIQSINVMQFIILLDSLSEAIQQIYRVLYNERNYKLIEDKSIFGKEISDDKYFSHIRASFAAHPVNLKSYDGTKSDNQYFASWSTKHGNGDFNVYLYSNNPEEADRILSIYFDQLIKYAEKRYLLLKEFVNEIKRQEEEHNVMLSKLPIKVESYALTQLLILREENKKRFGDYGYQDVIDELINLFDAPMMFPTDNELYINFLDKLKPAIQEIYQNLKNMKVFDLSIYPYPRTFLVKDLQSARYDLEKFSEYFTNPNYHHGKVSDHLDNLIIKGIFPHYASLAMDKRDLRLLSYAWLEKHGASIHTPYYERKIELNSDKVEVIIIDDIYE
ncbi:hypothetical protein M3649_19205 [Ureibacillus chungkukjangi]|uniref:hypothetical protein n=1 Tax=Ureibacillus chungkukjangi TaxID=1202712 RepID=UPI0020421CA5|nr:hypothetical protein [Ureibacillus chungkukjangi]MCM3390229.1 hypothetical protein [Ureibacillus chungkukjangi]